jgi:hypothetical protein
MRVAVKAVGVFVLVWCVGCGVAAQGFALPEGRVYEMVSPPYKAGYGVQGNLFTAALLVAPDGERVAFNSQGGFAGDPSLNAVNNQYIVNRQADVGWSTAPLSPPASILPWGEVVDFSRTLGVSLAYGKSGRNEVSAFNEGVDGEFLLHRTDAPDTAPNASEPDPSFPDVPNPAPNFEVEGMVLEDLNKTPFPVTYEGASGDFSHVVVDDPTARSEEQLLPEAAVSESHLYDLAVSSPCGGLSGAVCREPAAGGGPSLRLVGLNNTGKVINPACRAQAGGGLGGHFNDVSADGNEIFFETQVSTSVTGSCEDVQVFVRLGGQRTLEVSRPLDTSKPFGGCGDGGKPGETPGEVPCAGASERKESGFDGASEDGSKVFFGSAQPLVPGQSDESQNLYMAMIGCGEGEPGCEPAKREVTSLVQVSHDPNAGQPAEVIGHLAIAPDGSHAYYVARGQLLEKGVLKRLEEEHRPLPRAGADNLYVYDSLTGTTGFVADLCSGPEKSGTVEDIRCPAGLTSGESVFDTNDTPLWTGSPQAEVNVCERPSTGECTGDRETGRFLAFSSYGRLTADDVDGARDVYRYDAATETLERVSLGEGGHDSNGNNSAFDASIPTSAPGGQFLYSQQNMDSRIISEDGSRVVFTSAEPLSEVASNGLSNAYEWHDGIVSIVSTGSATAPVEYVVISSSGRDLFFITNQGLVPQDTDGQTDIYDARIGGGFPVPPAEPQPCKGDACQGPLSAPAPALVPGGTATQTAGENLPPPAKASPKKLTRAQRLARALKACAKKPKRKRAACRGSAQKKYAKAAKSVKRGRQ